MVTWHLSFFGFNRGISSFDTTETPPSTMVRWTISTRKPQIHIPKPMLAQIYTMIIHDLSIASNNEFGLRKRNRCSFGIASRWRRIRAMELSSRDPSNQPQRRVGRLLCLHYSSVFRRRKTTAGGSLTEQTREETDRREGRDIDQTMRNWHVRNVVGAL